MCYKVLILTWAMLKENLLAVTQICRRSSEAPLVMHQSFVTTPPAPEQGGGKPDKCAVFLLCIVPIVRRKCQGFDIHRQIFTT